MMPASDVAGPIRAGTRSRPRNATMLLAATFAVVWLVSLSRSLFDPPGFDHGLYQYITERVMAGERMYVDVWDQNLPGIIGIHWLASVLVGRSPVALRVFDAGWQLLTLIALVALCVRDGRRWQVGWLAAALYVLAYYGLGYVNTAQREGFAVLPLLLAAHAIAPAGPRGTPGPLVGARHLFAGIMGLAAFALKPPLGLCFGILWLLTLSESWRRRGEGRPAWAGITALTAGFTLAAAAGVGLVVRLGWWDGFWPVLTRRDVPGYIHGVDIIRAVVPYGVAGLAVIGCVAWCLRPSRNDRHPVPGQLQSWGWARILTVGAVIFGLLVTVERWPAWQQTFVRLAGLLLPALGAVLLSRWRQRSRIWRVNALLAGASFAALVWQGWFYLYHYPPLLAFAAYLAANEMVDRFKRFNEISPPARIWGVACLAGAAHLAVSTWGWTMTFYTRSPYVLADATLAEHYTRVTKHKTRFPTYETTAQVAERVRALTTESDPIACLLDEPRIYWLSQRPAVYPLVRMQDCYSHKFPGLLRAVCDRMPKVVLARIPRAFRDTTDHGAIQSAVFKELTRYFGPPARMIRQRYRITEIINNDVCILEPGQPGQ